MAIKDSEAVEGRLFVVRTRGSKYEGQTFKLVSVDYSRSVDHHYKLSNNCWYTRSELDVATTSWDKSTNQDSARPDGLSPEDPALITLKTELQSVVNDALQALKMLTMSLDRINAFIDKNNTLDSLNTVDPVLESIDDTYDDDFDDDDDDYYDDEGDEDDDNDLELTQGSHFPQ
jgi:hypothetical protein